MSALRHLHGVCMAESYHQRTYHCGVLQLTHKIKKKTLCREFALNVLSISETWTGSEYSSAYLAHSMNACRSTICLPSSFNFVSRKYSSNIHSVQWTVDQPVTCDLMTCASL